MLNQEMRTVTMSRSNMLRVQQALTSMVIDYRREATDPETTEDIKKIARRSLAMWEKIRNDFVQQMKDQDPEEFRQ